MMMFKQENDVDENDGHDDNDSIARDALDAMRSKSFLMLRATQKMMTRKSSM